MTDESPRIDALARPGHATHCKMCLQGLPSSQVELDPSKMALAFYCIGTLDLLDVLKTKANEHERHLWQEWIWEQQTRGRYGTGFKPSSFTTPTRDAGSEEEPLDYDPPHMIMTYTALLSLAVLRDDFSRLDRAGLMRFVKECQESDGSFSTIPKAGDADLRTTYCAFAICSMLDDWSSIDIGRAIEFIAACRTYEGGYGQAPFCEAQGGTTYCALAALHLAPGTSPPHSLPSRSLSSSERKTTIRWLVQNQCTSSGGFRGRTEKGADACYCFWCGASLEILDAKEFVNVPALAVFLSRCQFKFGGIAKDADERPDPYHTYLSLAALAIYPPAAFVQDSKAASWSFEPLDPLLNAKESTAKWARERISGR